MAMAVRLRLMEECQRRKEADGEELPEVPAPVIFRAKHGLLVLEDYDAPEFPAEYWSKWTKKSFVDYDQVKSWVDPDMLLDIASRAGYWDMAKAAKVCLTLREGASIGCTGRAGSLLPRGMGVTWQSLGTG